MAWWHETTILYYVLKNFMRVDLVPILLIKINNKSEYTGQEENFKGPNILMDRFW